MENIYFITEDEAICLDKVVQVKKETCFYDELGQPLKNRFYMNINFNGGHHSVYGFADKEERNKIFDLLITALRSREGGKE